MLESDKGFLDLSEINRLNEIEKLVNAIGINNENSASIIINSPELRQLSSSESAKTIRKINETNRILPIVKNDITSVLTAALEIDSNENDSPERKINLITQKILEDDNPKKLGTELLYAVEVSFLREPENNINIFHYNCPHVVYLAAAANTGNYISLSLYKNDKNEETKKCWITYTNHFTAIETIAIGAKTQSYVAAIYPEKVDIEIMNNIVPIENVGSLNNIKRRWTRQAFEGKKMTPIVNIDNDTYYAIINKKITDDKEG